MYILDDSKINGLTLWLILVTYIQEKEWPKKKTLIHQLTELPTNRLLLTNQQRHLKQARYSDPETEIKQAVWRRRWQTKDTDKTRQDKTRQDKQNKNRRDKSFILVMDSLLMQGFCGRSVHTAIFSPLSSLFRLEFWTKIILIEKNKQKNYIHRIK